MQNPPFLDITNLAEIFGVFVSILDDGNDVAGRVNGADVPRMLKLIAE